MNRISGHLDSSKAGDTVWDLVYGKGVIIDVRDHSKGAEFPITVEFREPKLMCIIVKYSLDGRFRGARIPSLFLQEVEVPIPDKAYQKPQSIPVDTHIWVWNDDKKAKVRRRFKEFVVGWDAKIKVKCFYQGENSSCNRGLYKTYENYELVEKSEGTRNPLPGEYIYVWDYPHQEKYTRKFCKFTPEGKVVAVGQNGFEYQWNRWEPMLRLMPEKKPEHCNKQVRFPKDGDEILVWDAEGRKKVKRRFKEFNLLGYAVCYSMADILWSPPVTWRYWEPINEEPKNLLQDWLLTVYEAECARIEAQKKAIALEKKKKEDYVKWLYS